jgi:DNA polymerase III subunit delta
LRSGCARFLVCLARQIAMMAQMAAKRFVMVCGSDDYVVTRLGQARFETLAGDADEFSRDIVNGFSGTVGEVEDAVNRFREAVQTLPLFGGRRVIWLKDVNFLADSVTGRAEGTLKQVEALQQILESIDPAQVALVITASPIDRRRSFPRWCESAGECVVVEAARGAVSPGVELAEAEARELGVRFSPGALPLLVAKSNGNSRLMVEEVRKLATYLGEEGALIDEKLVEELVPDFGEGDFFEAAEAFFSRDLSWTLASLRRHFFSGGGARSLISGLQNRNRLLIQLRALGDAGLLRLGGRSWDKGGFERAARAYRGFFGSREEKSGFNVFTQNPWYLGKLATAGIPPLRRLIDHQEAFIEAFSALIERPNEEEEIMRELAIRCLV